MTEERRELNAGVERLLQQLESRALRAEERDRVADERDATSDEREQLADERDRIADVREWQLSQARAPRPGDMRRRSGEMLKQARRANERERARIDRLEDGLARSDADEQRQAAELEYRMARHKLEHSTE